MSDVMPAGTGSSSRLGSNVPSGETIPLLFSACVPVQLQAVPACCLLVSQVVTRCRSLKLPDVPVTQCWRHPCSAGIHRQTGDGRCWCWASKSCTVIVASHGSCIARCALFALVLCFVRNFVHILQHFNESRGIIRHDPCLHRAGRPCVRCLVCSRRWCGVTTSCSQYSVPMTTPKSSLL